MMVTNRVSSPLRPQDAEFLARLHDLDTARAAYIAYLIKYPTKLLYLTRRVPARDQNDANQEQNDIERLQEPEQQAERSRRLDKSVQIGQVISEREELIRKSDRANHQSEDPSRTIAPDQQNAHTDRQERERGKHGHSKSEDDIVWNHRRGGLQHPTHRG